MKPIDISTVALDASYICHGCLNTIREGNTGIVYEFTTGQDTSTEKRDSAVFCGAVCFVDTMIHFTGQCGGVLHCSVHNSAGRVTSANEVALWPRPGITVPGHDTEHDAVIDNLIAGIVAVPPQHLEALAVRVRAAIFEAQRSTEHEAHDATTEHD